MRGMPALALVLEDTGAAAAEEVLAELQAA
jgi:hypothetical protein